MNKAIVKQTFKLIALAFLVAQALAVTVGPELPDPGRTPMTHDQQIKLGLQAAQQVYQQMPVLPDNSPETQYIRQLGERLVAVIPQEYSWPYEFHVVAQKEINAFALPGGQMFVNIGTIAAADNEAQLAGVMAHEMSHVYMQHSAKQAGKTQAASAIAGIAGAVLGIATHGSILGQLGQAGIMFGAQGVIMKYSREDEAQADAVGAIIMWKAGYNPQAMADFFAKLAQQGGSGPQFLSDHPNPGNREQAIQKEIASWPQKRYITTSAAFDRVRQDAMGVKSYTAQEISQGSKSGQWSRMNRANGAVFTPPKGYASTVPVSANDAGGGLAGPVSALNLLPSSRMVTANLGALRIAHPENWQVIQPSQRGQDVRIAPQAGVVGEAIGCGVALNLAQPRNGQSVSIDQATSELVRALQQGTDIQAVGNAQPITVAGVQGRSVDMQSISPFAAANGGTQKERDWLVTVPRSDGSFAYFVFVAPESEFERFRPTFDNMLRSVHF